MLPLVQCVPYCKCVPELLVDKLIGSHCLVTSAFAGIHRGHVQLPSHTSEASGTEGSDASGADSSGLRAAFRRFASVATPATPTTPASASPA